MHNDAYIFYKNNCANYVSQCLLAGGLNLAASGHKVDSKGSIYYVRRLFEALSVLGLSTLAINEIPDELAPGDLIFFGCRHEEARNFDAGNEFQHIGIITMGRGEGARLCSQTEARLNWPIEKCYPSFFPKARFCRIDVTAPRIELQTPEGTPVDVSKPIAQKNIILSVTDDRSGLKSVVMTEAGIQQTRSLDKIQGKTTRRPLRLDKGRYRVEASDDANNKSYLDFEIGI